MDTITGFYIVGLTMEGFKCYGQPTQFRFGHNNLIRGGNGEGKSSIADAIAFAVTGVPFFGEAGQDRLYSQGGESLCITMDFIDDKGRRHSLKRKRARIKGKDKMILWFDDAPTRQLDLDFLFGERDVFLSIINPLYFIERLGEQGRALLERYQPDIPHEEVMARLDELSRTQLAEENLLSAEGYLRRLREEQAETTLDITRAEGLRDYLIEQENQRAQAHTAVKTQLAGVEERMAALEKGRTEGIDLSALDERYADLCAQYEEQLRDGPAEPSETMAEIEQARQVLSECRTRVYESAYLQATADAGAEVKILRNRYETLRRDCAALKNSDTFCPTCGCEMTGEEMDAAHRALAEKLQSTLEEGRAKAAQVEEIQALDAKALEVFEQFKRDDTVAAEENLRSLQAKLEAERTEASMQHEQALAKRREELQEVDFQRSRGGLTDEEAAELTALIARRETLTEELEKQDDPEDSTGDKAADISTLQARLGELDKKINAAKRYIEKRVELQFSCFQLNHVDISLYDTVKTTGELHSTFKFTYDGRPYRWLSMSEKLRAGMEVSLLVQRLTGRCYPLFVDNGECIPVIGDFRPAGQSFMARVVSGLPLEVKTFGSISEENAPPVIPAA